MSDIVYFFIFFAFNYHTNSLNSLFVDEEIEVQLVKAHGFRKIQKSLDPSFVCKDTLLEHF